MHHRETFKTTNTARLACLALEQSEILIRGKKDSPLNLQHLLNTERIPLYLTLADSADTLSPQLVQNLKNTHNNKPFHLIVPDGNWRQASRMGKREAVLKNLPWVKLPPGPMSRYRLRYEHDVNGLSTLEAIARAYSLVEDNTMVESQLLEIFEVMVERTLQTRPGRREARFPGQN